MFRSISSFYLSLLNFFSNIWYYFLKKIDLNNKQLEGVFNKRYKKIKKLGEGAQGTVFEVEDLNESKKK